MKSRSVSLMLCMAAVTALLLQPLGNILGCGPFFERTVFVDAHFPDPPFENFAAGKLGVLQPTYYRANLYIAYRVLAGKPFNARERQALAALWDWKARRDWMRDVASQDENEVIQLWMKARKQFSGRLARQPDPGLSRRVL